MPAQFIDISHFLCPYEGVRMISRQVLERQAIGRGGRASVRMFGSDPRLRIILRPRSPFSILWRLPRSKSGRTTANWTSAPRASSQRACASRSGIPAMGWARRACRVCVNPSKRRSPTAWAWASRSAVRLSKPTVGDQVRAAGRSLSVHDPRRLSRHSPRTVAHSSESVGARRNQTPRQRPVHQFAAILAA
jgi:hypothetical protein